MKLTGGEFPFKPGIALLTDDVYTLHDALYKKGEEFISMSQLDIDADIVFGGENTGTLRSAVEWFFKETVAPGLDKYKKEHIQELFKSREDVEKLLLGESEHVWPEVTARDKNGNAVTISRVKYIVTGTRKVKEVEQEHKVFNNKIVSVGKHVEDDGTSFDFRVVQDPDTRKVHFNWGKKKAVIKKKKVVKKNNNRGQTTK